VAGSLHPAIIVTAQRILDAKPTFFVGDFVVAWDEVMNFDRFDRSTVRGDLRRVPR